ncbi:hypothetical protein EDB89DRAFT_2077343 [Lactarius sanguifluus]|nr:hypothetical protein EDB89DRAFT_2077343 [Lactarius sanguifluus]
MTTDDNRNADTIDTTLAAATTTTQHQQAQQHIDKHDNDHNNDNDHDHNNDNDDKGEECSEDDCDGGADTAVDVAWDKVDKWKQNWTDRISRVWNQKKPALEGDLEYLWASFLKDFGHAFAWNRKSTPRPPSTQTGMRMSAASQPKTDVPRQRRDCAVQGGSLSAAARDRIYQMAASTQPLLTPPACPPAPPSAPVAPVASVSAPAPPPAGPTPSWPGPITFSNPVMPDSAWTGPITFAHVIQMKRGRCFNCNKKGHVMRTCHAAGRAAIKTPSVEQLRKNKSAPLDPTPPSSSGAGTSTTRPTPASAAAGPSTITGKRGDPLFTPANLATLEADTLPPLDWLKPFFTEAQLDDYQDGETTPVAFQRTLHGLLKARVERKLRRRRARSKFQPEYITRLTTDELSDHIKGAAVWAEINNVEGYYIFNPRKKEYHHIHYLEDKRLWCYDFSLSFHIPFLSWDSHSVSAFHCTFTIPSASIRASALISRLAHDRYDAPWRDFQNPLTTSDSHVVLQNSLILFSYFPFTSSLGPGS